jgi:hypothetical protein
VTYGDEDGADYVELREEIVTGIEKSKRLVARSRELIAAAAKEPEGPEPPAVEPDPKLPQPPAR